MGILRDLRQLCLLRERAEDGHGDALLLGPAGPADAVDVIFVLLGHIIVDDARHNCWAYVLHTGQKRYSDDGEPQGTAGQPILNVLEREGVQDVLCVVTRYFGGILLGAGGLCRAYTKAAKDALDDAGISELRPWSVLRFDCPYALFERVKLETDKRGGLVRDADYGAQIALTILLPQPEEAAFRKALQELSAGSLAPETTGTELRGVRIR